MDYIAKALGCNVEKQTFTLPGNTPLYLKNSYVIEKYLIQNQECLFVKPLEFSLASYKKHKAKFEQLTGFPVVLLSDCLTPYQRKILIEEQLPFVENDAQIYLPFLAICLTEKYQRKNAITKFMPVTQAAFLYYLYNPATLTINELAQKLGYTDMSISRAYKELADSGLYSFRSEGRKKYLVTEKATGELLTEAEPFLINPVEKTAYCKGDKTQCLKAGVYALSQKTMLDCNESDICYAVTKSEYNTMSDIVTEEEYDLTGGAKIEIWNYNPSLLTKDDTVDDISLILSLRGARDERVNTEIEKLRSKYKW